MLPPDLEWKLTYVGSATSDQYDQELDSLLVGPIPVGVNKFVFEADPPDTKRIPDAEILGVTVILLTCAYDGREFVRVGYYVNNEYETEELNADPPAKPVIEKIRRNVLDAKPRVTRFAIKWYVMPTLMFLVISLTRTYTTNLLSPSNRDSEASAPAEFPPEQPEADLVADGDEYGAEELAEEDEEEVDGAGPSDTNGAAEAAHKEDAAMEGVDDNAEGEAEGENGVEEDEMSEDGSVDIEGESEDELVEEEDEEGEGEGEAGEGGDEMEVDTDAKPADAAGAKHAEVMAH